MHIWQVLLFTRKEINECYIGLSNYSVRVQDFLYLDAGSQLLSTYIEIWEFAHYYFKITKQKSWFFCSLFNMSWKEFNFWVHCIQRLVEGIKIWIPNVCEEPPLNMFFNVPSGKLKNPQPVPCMTLRNSTSLAPWMGSNHLYGVLVSWGVQLMNILQLTVLLWLNIGISVTSIYTLQKTGCW